MTLAKLTPTPDQEAAIVKMVSEPTAAALNASEMGAGKTLMAVEVALRRGCRTILVIAPLGTLSGWQGAFQRQGSDLPFHWIGGKDAKENLNRFQNDESGVYFIGTELFSRWGWISHTLLDSGGMAILHRPTDKHKLPRRTALQYADKSPVLDIHGNPVMVDEWKTSSKRAPLSTWKKTTPDMVINDEIHRGQNRNGLFYSTLKQLKTHYRMGLSGTPYGNKFSGAWAVTRWLWPKLIDTSFWRWAAVWAEMENDVFAGKKITGEKNPGAFFNSLPCYVRIEPPIEEPDYIPEYVDLSAAQRKQYDKLERDLFVEADGNNLIIEVPAVVRIRLREATLAEFSVTENQEVYFKPGAKSTKFKRLAEIIEREAGNSMLILTDSAKYARIVVPMIHKLGYEAAEWSGDVSRDTRELIRGAFSNGDFPYLVATIPSIREGIDGLADSCGIVVNLSHSDNGVWDRQARARIIGRYKGRVRWYDILANDTYDLGQLSTLTKQKLAANVTLRQERK